MPMADDIGKAYQNYYTHDQADDISTGALKRGYQQVKRGYLARRFGYRSAARHGPLARLGPLLYLFPIRRAEVDDEIRHLRARQGGKLLDVGCGSGKWLSRMRDLGWDVAGVDFDADAVAEGVRRGLRVAHGPVEAQRYPDESFDAVMLNHVIEHVPDPVATLAECRRIVKPGGEVLLFTPNGASLAHRVFKRAWRGLEPPRHLHLFSPVSMRTLLARAGFVESDVRTVNSKYIWRHSLGVRLDRAMHSSLPFSLEVVAWMFTLAEQSLLTLRPDVGECVAARALRS